MVNYEPFFPPVAAPGERMAHTSPRGKVGHFLIFLNEMLDQTSNKGKHQSDEDSSDSEVDEGFRMDLHDLPKAKPTANKGKSAKEDDDHFDPEEIKTILLAEDGPNHAQKKQGVSLVSLRKLASHLGMAKKGNKSVLLPTLFTN